MGGAWGGFVWGGATWGRSPRRRRRAAPPAAVGTWLEALASLLRAAPELEGVRSIYLKGVPPLRPTDPLEGRYPYLLISPIDYRPLVTNSRTSQWGPQEVQYTLCAIGDVDAETLGEAAYDALWPRVGYRRIRFANGAETGRIAGKQFLTEQPGRVRGRAIWHFAFFYTHNLTRGH